MIGADGFAMLGLSSALILLSCGTSLLAALGWVLAAALRAPWEGPRGRRVLVLGVRLDRSGRLSRLYRERLERALALDGPEGEFVLLGGRTRQDAPPEAWAGRIFLEARGVAAERIRLEDRSRHTLENFRLYRTQFPPVVSPPLLVTSRFHLARASLMAAGLGIAHAPCAAEQGFAQLFWDLPRLLREAFLVHWYLTGAWFARVSGHRRMAARIR